MRVMAFRLCLALGWPHPDFLLKTLSHKQFQEWMTYYSLEPWGFDVEDARHAILNSSVLRAAGAKSVKPEQFSMVHKEPVTMLDKALTAFGIRRK